MKPFVYATPATSPSAPCTLCSLADRQNGHRPGTFRHFPLRSDVQYYFASIWALHSQTGQSACSVLYILKPERRRNGDSSIFLPTCVQNRELPAVRLGIPQCMVSRQHLQTGHKLVPDNMVSFMSLISLPPRLTLPAGSSGLSCITSAPRSHTSSYSTTMSSSTRSTSRTKFDLR